MSDSWDPGFRLRLTTLGPAWAGFLSQFGASVSPSVKGGPRYLLPFRLW